MSNAIFEKLNNNQIEAVKTVYGPVMAVAGAGSGKTRVLTNRISYLIEEVGIPSTQILAITFTNKAAEEMRNRVHRMIEVPVSGIWISTFHSMGAKILRNDIHHLGYKHDFQIIDDDDQQIVIKKIMKELNMDPKRFIPRAIASIIERAKADSSVFQDIEEPMSSISFKIFQEYQSFLFRNNLVDFQDLLVLVIALFEQFDEVLEKYQRWFQYILVDEFQDTNDLQYRIVHALAKKNRNLFIVGDEDQSIYAFRGANIANIRKFMRDYPEHKKIILNQNYRSTNRILTAANQVISHNKTRIPKDLFSTLGEGEYLTHYKGQTDDEEAYYIYSKIKQLHKDHTLYKDMAILYRNNAMSRKFEDLLLKYNIPYRVIGNLSFYKRKEIKDAMAYLRLVINLGDDYAFSRVYNEPRRGIGETSFEKMVEQTKIHHVKLMDLIDMGLDFLPLSTRQKLKQFKEMIEEIKYKIEDQNIIQTYENLLEKSGYMASLHQDGQMGDKMIENERRIENLQEFKTILLEKIKEYGDISNYEKLTIVLNEMTLREEAQEALLSDDYVSLMTMHSAKGLEFKVVFIACLEQGLFPSSQALFEHIDVEEERRLFYVALTRAKERVFLTNAESRFMYGHYQHNSDSEFLREIHDELIDRQGLAKKKTTIYEGIRRKPEPVTVTPEVAEYQKVNNQLSIGDKITHQVFGSGVVVMIDKDKATIAFQAPIGIKTLMKDHPSIKKG
ncbi:MAG: 3'-5' exonuclease [bacterium]|nr:3'-5' exonuclease [bacterium]